MKKDDQRAKPPEDFDCSPVPMDKPGKSLRKAPDVQDIARRGGLASTVTPYKLGLKDGELYVSASGNDTASVNTFAAAGFAKAVTDLRDLHSRFPDITVSEAKERIDNLNWVEDTDWLKRNVFGSDRPADELGVELRDGLIEKLPSVDRWGVSGPDRKKASLAYRSAWKNAIHQALMSLHGKPQSYRDVADWISEHVVAVDLPTYCNRFIKHKHELRDVGDGVREFGDLVYRHPSVRARFQKELAKVRADMRNAR